MCEEFNNLRYCLISGYVCVGNDTTTYQNAIVDTKLITEDLIIPAFIGAKKINYIGKCAFQGCRIIKRVNIEARIDTIKYAAFEYCTSLESINIPSSVKVIDKSAIRPTSDGIVVQGRINITFEKGSKIKQILGQSLRGKKELNVIFCDNRAVVNSSCTEVFLEGDDPNIYAMHSFCGYQPKGKPFGCYRRETYCTNCNRHSCRCATNLVLITIIALMLQR